MKSVYIDLMNCFGISSLKYDFDFDIGKSRNKAYAIYAPNGLMKTSFAKTFERLSEGKLPEEERYQRATDADVRVNGVKITAEEIFVLKSEIDVKTECSAITDILVNPENKLRYDEISLDIEAQKIKLINVLQKASGVPKKDIEKTLISDSGEKNFFEAIRRITKVVSEKIVPDLSYSILFDPKNSEILKNPEFLANAKEFSARYHELFTQEGSIYQKGVFNPNKADLAFASLEKQGFFDTGHRLYLRGDSSSIGKEELEIRLKKIHERIDNDKSLKAIRINLAKNAQTQALSDIIEKASASDIDELIEYFKPEKHGSLKIALWTRYLAESPETKDFLSIVEKYYDEIDIIEKHAANVTPLWTEAVELFNSRFVDMPFTLSVENHAFATLGREQAKLLFTFKDGNDSVAWNTSEIKTLSQGERRAHYLLYFIFEVQLRIIKNRKTLFIIDDVADSFDYKNKHAILQYLKDLDDHENFYQIILTHNFDFFRSLANTFVHRDRCLMANRNLKSISLTKAEGVNNYFVGVLQAKIHKSFSVMCATVPFTRNIIEYTKGMKDEAYLKLTNLLHWKAGTSAITIADYLAIYNSVFSTNYAGDERIFYLALYDEAEIIQKDPTDTGLNLEDKVVLSIAIRMKAEEFLINEIRKSKNDFTYWCTDNSQFGMLMKEYKNNYNKTEALKVLEKVGITVSSNIHLNSFMYEPILDLTLHHLSDLYRQVKALS